MKKNHLPIFGIGPALCLPMVAVTAFAIYLSWKGVVPYTIHDVLWIWPMRILGAGLIGLGIACFVGADMPGSLINSIKSNQLKTDGSYAFVRNPCYAFYLLGCTGALLMAHNLYLLALPVLFWLEMTFVLKRTEEVWLTELYGQEYKEYCEHVNRCIPFLPKNRLYMLFL